MQPESPAKLRQEVNYLRQKLEYQQTLLEDERRVTDELITNKNTAIETLQRKLREDSVRHQKELQTLLQKHEEKVKSVREDMLRSQESRTVISAQEKATLQTEFDQKLAGVHLKFTQERAELKKIHQREAVQQQEAHRKELAKIRQQSDSALASLKEAHKVEMQSAQDELRALTQSSQKRAEAAVKSARKDFDRQLSELKQEMEDKDRQLSELKDRNNSFSRQMDKKIEEISRQYEKKIADLHSLNSKDSEEFKKNQLELYRKLEQRCFRLENEKQALRRQHEKDLEEMRVVHKQELQQQHERRMRSTDETRKETESKMKAAAVQHDSEITKLLQKHRDEVAYITETAKNKVKQIREEQEAALAQKQDIIRELEENLRKVQLQIAVQDSYWRKKEQQMTDTSKQQMLSMQSMNESVQNTQKLEMERYQKLLRQKDEFILQRDSELIALNNQLAEMKLQVEAIVNQRDHGVQGLNMKLQEFASKVEQSREEKETLHKTIKDLERELYEKSEIIERFRYEIERLEAQRVKDREAVAKSASRISTISRSTSPLRRPPSPPKPRYTPNTVAWEEVVDVPNEWVQHPLTVPDDDLIQRTLSRNSQRIAEPSRKAFAQPAVSGTGLADESFSKVRQDLQDVIQSHFDRIENLTEEFHRTPI